METRALSISPDFKNRLADLGAWTMRPDFFERFSDLCSDIPQSGSLPKQLQASVDLGKRYHDYLQQAYGSSKKSRLVSSNKSCKGHESLRCSGDDWFGDLVQLETDPRHSAFDHSDSPCQL